MADMNMQGSVGGTVSEVNTNSIAMFAADGTMLRVGFRGDTMFLTIIPRVSDPNGGRPRWPKEMGHTASMRPQHAMALYDGFMKRILPDIDRKQDHVGFCVVPLNRDATNLCGFSYAGGHATFTIFNGVSADRTCSDQYSFMFDPTPMIDSYNPNTGNYEIAEVQGQLFVIVEGLRSFGECSVNAVGHEVRNANSWNSDMIISHLRSIATKLGVTAGQYGRYRGAGGYGGYGYTGGNTPFVADEQPSSSYNQAPLNVPSQLGSNDNVTWSAGFSEAANVGHTGVPDVQQVSSLDSLMG